MSVENGRALYRHRAHKGLKGVLPWFLDLLFPSSCPLCGSPTEAALCQRCLQKVIPLREPLCPRCGLPYPPGSTGHLCTLCERGEYAFLQHRSFGLYEGVLKEALHRFKFGGDRSLVTPLGEMLLEAFRGLDGDVDLLIPIPLSKKRLLQRGFNQSLLLAHYLRRRTGVPCSRNLLVKARETSPQTSLGRKGRKENVKGAFQVRDRKDIHGKKVLLVDDVFTTGATLSEAAKVLLRAGAKEVLAVTVARRL